MIWRLIIKKESVSGGAAPDKKRCFGWSGAG
jgi:hypothetical protein